ncbi:hypothetical protein D3C81_2044780 [compost metagenome]
MPAPASIPGTEGERPVNTRMAVQLIAALSNSTTLPSTMGTASKPRSRRLTSTMPRAASSIMDPR